MVKKTKLTYIEAGVDYEIIDSVKRTAQIAGKKTKGNLYSSGCQEIEASRGESAYVIDCGDMYIASIEECLGTKSLIADEMRQITGKTYYDNLAKDTIAMMINDIITVGARPITVLAYWAAGSTNWFNDKKRTKDLVMGWRNSCDISGVSWGGGETPVLSGVINKSKVDLAGACIGIIKPKSRLILGEKLRSGDVIILFESSGIHANGLSLARKIADSLTEGYATKLENGTMYGEALLQPTFIYAKLVKDLFDNNIDIHYIVNITGHGWRKIMRHRQAFTYRIESIPPIPEELALIQKKASLSDKEAYGTFNMGAGFAIFTPPKDKQKVISLAKKYQINAYIAGRVEKGKKQVIIEPKNITYKKDSLQLRV